jgi:PAS domain S-box-containing protein/diguanylate cyclase (GGDEF)-like protein
MLAAHDSLELVSGVVTARLIRILAVEDVAADLMLAERALQRAGLTCTVERVETAHDFRRSLESDPDLILCDFKLQQFDGLAALEIATAHAHDIPFIFLSGTIGEERAIEALKSGATDYVLKSNLARLVPAVIRALEDRDERRIARQTGRRFRDLVEASQDWIWELDADGRYVFSSSSARTILGWTDAEILGAHYLAHVHEDDRAEIERALHVPDAKERRLTSATVRIRHRDGSYRWLERHALALFDSRGLVTGYRGTDRDVTERKLQAARIERLSRIHMMLSSINAAVLRTRDRPELLQEVCRIAASQGGYAMATVLLVDPGTATARSVASAGVRIDCLTEFSVTLRATAATFSSLTEEALVTARPVICNDLADPSRTVYGRQGLLARGLRAFSCWPLSVDGTVVGALDLGSSEPNAFDEEEMSLLRQVAGSLSFALQYIEKEDAAEYLAYFDPMTGLARRELFCERIARTLSGPEPNDARELVVLALDVERLGAINDRYGRHAGDLVTQLVAERLKTLIADPSHLAYLGNGSFSLVTSGVRTGNASIAQIDVDMKRLFARPLLVDGQQIRISLRIGAAQYPADGVTADALLQGAEIAIKSAKENGERYLKYAAGMNAVLHQRMTLEQQLRNAVERRELVLHYQPKLHLHSGRIAGVEALFRWRDPDGTLRSPAGVIPVLEESGLMVDVGQWVIEQAVADTLDWHARGLPSIPIAVNVSPLQLKRGEFVDWLLSAIAPVVAVGRRIDVEITESGLMIGMAGVASALDRLAAAGMGIAIDDFGTGYSSLSRLTQLSVEYLKIDRSFITKLDVNPRNLAVVSTILSLARSLNMVAIAEGVETQGELRELLRLGCQQFQGFIAAKPMPADELRSLIAVSGGAIMPPLTVADHPNGKRSRRAAHVAKVESESRLAQSEAIARERERLAYELHDGICQQLAGMSFLLAPLVDSVAQLDSGAARELEHIATLLKETSQAARTLAEDRTGGAERESSDLQGALQLHAARLQAAHGVTIQVDVTALSGEPLSGIAVGELAKLVREAMRNAIRHGRARSVIVRLKDAGHDWQLEIRDDGVGSPDGFTRRGSLGLRSMRHRAARLQGTFEIVRLEPRGTSLRVTWPKRSE